MTQAHPPRQSAFHVMTGLFSLPSGARIGAAPMIAAVILVVIVCASILAPLYVPYDPLSMNAMARLRPLSEGFYLGTNPFGPDIFGRVMTGGRVSLLIGVGAAVVSVSVGLLIGLVAGFFRAADGIIMRIMDSLLAIPAILLAIALVALNGPSLGSVIIAITVPEVPRVVRLVRAVVRSAREEPYVEAAIALGSSLPKILLQHLMPNTFAPLIVQGTYICASAILIEALLSFLDAGVSTEIPTWGNIKPGLIFWPGLILSLCILAIDLLGDTARDLPDPRMKKREV